MHALVGCRPLPVQTVLLLEGCAIRLLLLHEGSSLFLKVPLLTGSTLHPSSLLASISCKLAVLLLEGSARRMKALLLTGGSVYLY